MFLIFEVNVAKSSSLLIDLITSRLNLNRIVGFFRRLWSMWIGFFSASGVWFVFWGAVVVLWCDFFFGMCLASRNFAWMGR